MFKFIILSSSLFFIGILGLFLVRRHILICLISIELMLLGCILILLHFPFI
jgi:NADH:ubiquinone oxidoreductase subunit K